MSANRVKMQDNVFLGWWKCLYCGKLNIENFNRNTHKDLFQMTDTTLLYLQVNNVDRGLATLLKHVNKLIFKVNFINQGDILVPTSHVWGSSSVVRRPFLVKGPPHGVYCRCSIANTSPEYRRAADLRNPYSFR